MPTTTEAVMTGFAVTLATHADHIRTHGRPDLPVVSRTEVDTIEAVFRWGKACDVKHRYWCKGMRQYVYLVPAWPPGQVVKQPSPNIIGVFEPRYRDDKLVVVEWGCTHEWEQVAKGNCYSESRCTICGMHYGVDSSG